MVHIIHTFFCRVTHPTEKFVIHKTVPIPFILAPVDGIGEILHGKTASTLRMSAALYSSRRRCKKGKTSLSAE